MLCCSGDPQAGRGQGQVVGAVGPGQVDLPALRVAAHRPRPRDQLPEFARPAGAPVAAECLGLDPVHPQQPEGVGVVAGGDQDLVAGGPQPGDDRPEHQRVRRRGHVDPDAHYVGTWAGRAA